MLLRGLADPENVVRKLSCEQKTEEITPFPPLLTTSFNIFGYDFDFLD